MRATLTIVVSVLIPRVTCKGCELDNRQKKAAPCRSPIRLWIRTSRFEYVDKETWWRPRWGAFLKKNKAKTVKYKSVSVLGSSLAHMQVTGSNYASGFRFNATVWVPGSLMYNPPLFKGIKIRIPIQVLCRALGFFIRSLSCIRVALHIT